MGGPQYANDKSEEGGVRKHCLPTLLLLVSPLHLRLTFDVEALVRMMNQGFKLVKQ